MRTIKFIVWDGKYMDYDVWVNSCGAFGEPEKKYNTPNIEISSYPNKSIIMQFTGLHDKNGKEIFEGEILYNNDRKENCVVKYDEEKAMFIVEYLESKDKFTLWESISNLYYSVGNIYENQELLDKNLAD